jgi:hypothetical protein
LANVDDRRRHELQRWSDLVAGSHSPRVAARRRLTAGSGVARTEQRLLPTSHDCCADLTSGPTRFGRSRWIFIFVRLGYLGAAALALFLLCTVESPVASAQMVVQLVGGSAALVLATAAALGKFSIPFIRHACTISGLWLMVVPQLLSGPISYPTFFAGLAIFWLAGWADDAITLRAESEDPI